MPAFNLTLALLVTALTGGHAGPAAAEAQARAVQPGPVLKQDRLPVPAPGASMVDLESLAQQRSGGIAATGPALMVFISFSLPDATLQRLVEQAEASGALLLLRGLEQQSLVKTTEHARRLIGGHHVAWQIDPRAFRQYAVQHAPTFVLARSGAGGGCNALQCAGGGDYLAVAGDVSLDFALAHMADAAPEYAGLAGQFLARMRRPR